MTQIFGEGGNDASRGTKPTTYLEGNSGDNTISGRSAAKSTIYGPDNNTVYGLRLLGPAQQSAESFEWTGTRTPTIYLRCRN